MDLNRAPRMALLLVLAQGLTACGDSPTEPDPFDMNEVVFAEELGVDLAVMEETESGLFFENEVVGEGVLAEVGSPVEVHYTGWLPDGSQFDTSLDGDPPYDFTLGDPSAAIAGFQEGILGMRVGGERLLVIPPDLAYGQSGTSDGVIPPNSAIVFRVELVSATEPSQ